MGPPVTVCTAAFLPCVFPLTCRKIVKSMIYYKAHFILGGLMTELFCEKLNEDALRALPVLTLAHVGDGVYELLVRSHVVRQGAVKVADMHRQTVALVSAPAQAKAAKAIVPLLTEAEKAVFQRGRNTRLNSIPKHATLSDYSYATALKAKPN